MATDIQAGPPALLDHVEVIQALIAEHAALTASVREQLARIARIDAVLTTMNDYWAASCAAAAAAPQAPAPTNVAPVAAPAAAPAAPVAAPADPAAVAQAPRAPHKDSLALNIPAYLASFQKPRSIIQIALRLGCGAVGVKRVANLLVARGTILLTAKGRYTLPGSPGGSSPSCPPPAAPSGTAPVKASRGDPRVLQAEILAALAGNHEVVTSREVATILGWPPAKCDNGGLNVIYKAMLALAREGRVESPERGRYRLPRPATAPTPKASLEPGPLPPHPASEPPTTPVPQAPPPSAKPLP